MGISRRDFVACGAATAVGAYISHGMPIWAGDAASKSASNDSGRPVDEDGSRLWLRYAAPSTAALSAYRQAILGNIVIQCEAPTDKIIGEEIGAGLLGMLGSNISQYNKSPAIQDGALIVGTANVSPIIKSLNWDDDLAKAGHDGFIIRTPRVDGHRVIAIASESEIGALYGVFHFLRLLQTGQPIDALDIVERPKLQVRMLNHWDNLNGTIERGYAGRSLWQWNDLPDKLSPRYTDYARVCASIGINATALNNVNADYRMLSAEYLRKAAALADLFRPYGIRVYLSANFAAPKRFGDLTTADPLDPTVAAWWKAKADEIYKLIPDFGGFLVKANSEGQPGPKDYGRNHAEGAAVLADALAPHGGNVIWRAFVYDEDIDPDRTKRAFIEFTKLDGQFRPNVILQVKNGPLDFQPREPFHPLFGALQQTPVFAEVQPSQEYLGQAKHLVYLGTMWKEFLDSDTRAKGPGSTVAKVLDGSVLPQRVTGVVGVVNPGLDANWCGHHFCQANWYAFGRLAWDHMLSAEQIAEEWIRMTFTNDDSTVRSIRDMMMSSRETFVKYTMPLGLHHLIGGDHYAPMPQNERASRKDWTAVFYHRAASDGVGFDRTRQGSKAVEQYFPPICDTFDKLSTCPEKLLLWFHHCPWDYKMQDGQTLWQALCSSYFQGTAEAAALQSTWGSLAGKIDGQRHQEVADRLSVQATDAAKWRDDILKYFQTFSGMPIPG
ncbi:MAG TPA: alpha-glucuronidase family glycosyl hydrolase [Pirellulales bacterium]